MNDAELLRWLLGQGDCCGCEETPPATAPERATPFHAPLPLPTPPESDTRAQPFHVPLAFPRDRGYVSAAAPPALPIEPATVPDEPFVISVPSWDSPQRPGRYAVPGRPVWHSPRTDAKGVFGAADAPGELKGGATALWDNGEIADGSGDLLHDRRVVANWADDREADIERMINPPSESLHPVIGINGRATPVTQPDGEIIIYNQLGFLQIRDFIPEWIVAGPDPYSETQGYQSYYARRWLDGAPAGKLDTRPTTRVLTNWLGARPRHPGSEPPPFYRVVHVVTYASDETVEQGFDRWTGGYRLEFGYHDPVTAHHGVREDEDVMVTDNGDYADGRQYGRIYWEPGLSYSIAHSAVPSHLSEEVLRWPGGRRTPGTDPPSPTVPNAGERYYQGVYYRYDSDQIYGWYCSSLGYHHEWNGRVGSTVIVFHSEMQDGADYPYSPYFVSPDGSVTAVRTDTPSHDRITAWDYSGLALSWAACRDADGGPVVLTEQGKISYQGANLNIIRETITAHRPGGRETCSVAQFEAEVLRVAPGSFAGFSALGQGHHSWPDAWAYAAMANGEARAITGHDPWRDAMKRRPAELEVAESHLWPARPGKRPEVTPPGAPRTPLGLTLADVLGQVASLDPWVRGDGPARLPREVRRAGQVDAAALAALAKRFAYSPAGWPEELDDRTSAALPLEVQFEAGGHQPVPPSHGRLAWRSWLLLRARATGPATTIRINGAELPMHRLGHNAGEARGWHPYLVELPADTRYTAYFSVEGPWKLSRALLLDRHYYADQGGGVIT